MARQLKMAEVTTIRTLHASGHSNRQIARLLGVHRETVGRYRLRAVRQLLKRGAEQSQRQFDFIEHHPLIRPLSDYSLSSLQAFRKERDHECSPS